MRSLAETKVYKPDLDLIKKIVLDLHNKERALLKIPLLELDEEICKTVSQPWAENLAAKNIFSHSKTKGYGENIANRSPMDEKSAEKLFNQWLNEKQNYKYAKYPEGNIDPSKQKGHYTQLIWKNSTKLGVGFAWKGKKCYLVTDYKPPGNISGQYPY